MTGFDEDTGVIMALKAIEQSIAAGRMSIDEMRPVQEFLPAIMAAIRDHATPTSFSESPDSQRAECAAPGRAAGIPIWGGVTALWSMNSGVVHGAAEQRVARRVR